MHERACHILFISLAALCISFERARSRRFEKLWIYTNPECPDYENYFRKYFYVLPVYVSHQREVC